MSEYQYYEFLAIDRPLMSGEQQALRGISSRARITANSFVNHYEWGDLKADPVDWMRRYFDAFVYTANWCTCRLALRVPRATFRAAELKPFAAAHVLTIEASDAHWIIDWALDESENYDRFGMEDGSGWMRRLSPLRDELLRGDLRPLYLGWLAAAARGDLSEKALEPEVPLDLSGLSPPQEALVEFLEVDPDMLAAAMAGSASVPEVGAAQVDGIETWLTEWSHDETADIVKLIAQGRAHEAERQVRSRHATWLKARRSTSASSASRRSVAQLRTLAESASLARTEREAKEHAKQEKKQRQQREATLRRLMTGVEKHWAAIDAQAHRGNASGYEQAVRALVDLEQGYALTSSRKEFDRALRRFLVRHATRGALMRRLTEAGLWAG